MQIGTNLFYDRSAAQMAALSARADAISTQISTEKRFSAPSQDVVAYDRLATIHQATANDAAYGTNLKLAQGLLQQSDTALAAVASAIQQAQELTAQAANGTLNDANRKTIATQLQSVRDTLVSLANTTDTRGQPLFGGATGDSAVTQAADGTVTFTGTGSPPTIPVADGVDVQASDSAARIFGGVPAAGGGTTDVFAVLATFVAALDSGNGIAAAGTAATDLSSALTQINAAQGSVGARGARLDLVAAQATDAAGARELDRSNLEDTDFSSAITELQKTMTVLQAMQASFTKLGQLSLFDYLR